MESSVKVMKLDIVNWLNIVLLSGYPVHPKVQAEGRGWQLLQGEPRHLRHGYTGGDGDQLLSMGHGQL